MTDRHASVRAWAAARGLAAAVARYDADAGPATATSAGRRAASDALGSLGGPPVTIADRRPDGRPVWPAGFTGSISHGSGTALALVGTTSAARALGIDVEAAAALPLPDAAFVLDDRELAWAAAQASPDGGATACWCAKEAAFKAWSEAAGGRLPSVDPRRHLHVTVRPDGSGGADLRVEPLAELAAAATGAAAVGGRLWWEDGTVVAVVLVAVSRPGAAGPSGRTPRGT